MQSIPQRKLKNPIILSLRQRAKSLQCLFAKSKPHSLFPQQRNQTAATEFENTFDNSLSVVSISAIPSDFNVIFKSHEKLLQRPSH